jgi:hypothetical protein
MDSQIIDRYDRPKQVTLLQILSFATSHYVIGM